MEITGNMINYYFVCPRKLWLFAHKITFEDENENVQIGKNIDQTSYKSDEKHVMIDNVVNIDLIRSWQVVHEVKKSKAMEESAVWQVKYYIYYLKKKGISVKKGVIDYPKLKKRVEINFTNSDEKQIDELLLKITEIINQIQPPAVIDDKICKKCAYYEYCYS